MQTFRGHGLSAVKLGLIVGVGDVAGLTIGRSPATRLFVLPCAFGSPKARWDAEIDQVYGPDAKANARRINTGTTGPDGMTESVLMDILTNQVDKDGDMHGGTVSIVTLEALDDSDAAYLVPANAFWRNALVERMEGGNE